MNTMNQKTAVVSTILAVLQERGVEYVLGGEVILKDILTDADKASVREFLFAGFRDGSINMTDEARAKHEEDSELKKYVSGLLNNWIKKNKEFNAGQGYTPKNPGSRSSDPQLKALKQLLTQYDAESKDYDEICIAIDKRTTEVAASKAKTVTINVNDIPEALRHLIPSN